MITAQPGELRVRNVPYTAFEKIRTVAKKKGITISRFVRIELYGISKNIPAKQSTAACNPCGEMRIRGVGNKSLQDWEKEAQYYGVDVSDIIKIRLIDAIDAMPDEMKTPLIDEDNI